MPLTLLAGRKSDLRPPKKTSATAEKLAAIKGEVVSALEDRIEELRRETEKVQETMARVLARIDSQGFAVKLDDLKTGRWHRVSTEVKTLQEVLEMFESNDA